jgi:prophage antirepressor-like protein
MIGMDQLSEIMKCNDRENKRKKRLPEQIGQSKAAWIISPIGMRMRG